MKKCEHCNQYIQPKRSSKQLRLYWSVIKLVWITQEEPIFKKPDDLSNSIKYLIGHTEDVFDINGEFIGIAPKSTNFKTMSSKDFNEYFDKVKKFIWDEIRPTRDAAFERSLCNLLHITPPSED